MKTKLLLLFILISATGFSQKYIFGKTITEEGVEIANTVVINMRTDQKVLTDKDGHFMIAAEVSDELRFVKTGFERSHKKIIPENFTAPLNILLDKSPYLIEEIELAFSPSGNLKKDVKLLDPPKKVVALNNDMNAYMYKPFAKAQPKLSMPSAFAPPNYSAGQVNLLGLASAVNKLFNKATEPPLTTPNYTETQVFYRRIKTEIDLSFYTSRGFKEEDIDRFLIYADRNYSLAKKYRKSFDVASISSALKMADHEYIKTHPVGA
ncbi:hypothetical protein CO230_10625 [Chryseobacterium sp. 6424]|uniref:hypothetical protein n=1 Tax=Chryseobacterium sp. 6424 TaxID=2039166 RepID=UPI000EFCBEB9|nr:hypothetical protein [Chryseobacterium sp. 6424]AYO58527.1 hypothetical protein CO230_10625 [Chryseobacterium sp. 6424]